MSLRLARLAMTLAGLDLREVSAIRTTRIPVARRRV